MLHNVYVVSKFSEICGIFQLHMSISFEIKSVVFILWKGLPFLKQVKNFFLILLIGVSFSDVLTIRKEVTNIFNLKCAIVDSTNFKSSLFNGTNEVSTCMSFAYSERLADIACMIMSMRRNRRRTN